MAEIIEKRYIYKVYKRQDDGTLTTAPVAIWAKEVITEPAFKTVINGGDGQLAITLARQADNFSEDEEVRLGNEVQLWCYDREAIDGTMLFRGFISSYKTSLAFGQEQVDIVVLGYASLFSKVILEDSSGNTGIDYLSYDPTEIVASVIDLFRADVDRIYWTDNTMQLTGSEISLSFNANTVREAIDSILKGTPEGWWWRVDPDGGFYWKPMSVVADHTFIWGKHIESMNMEKTIEDLVNRIYFVGGTPFGAEQIFIKEERSDSIARFLPSAQKMIDQRVTISGTATTKTARVFNAFSGPAVRATLTILDNNGGNPDRGYDIESIKPGQMMQIRNLDNTGTETRWDVGQWDTDYWDGDIKNLTQEAMQIMSVDYKPDMVTVEVSSRQPEVSKRIEDINRNMEATATEGIPFSPEVV